MRTCPDCHSLVDDIAVFCDNCGFRLSPVEREIEPTIKAEIPPTSKPAVQPAPAIEQTGACSSCGFLNMPGEMFCQNCGVQLAPVASSPPPPPEPVPPPISQTERPLMPPEVAPAPAAEPAPTAPEALPVSEQKPSIAECPNCGFQNFAGEKFCQNCGQSLGQVISPRYVPATEASSERIPEQEAVIQTAEALLPEEEQPAVVGELLTEGQGEASQPEELLEAVEAPIVEPLMGEIKLEEKAAEDVILPEAATPQETETAAPAEAQARPVEPPVPEPEPAPVPVTPVPAPSMARGIRGRLVVRSTGVEIPLPSGHDEITIGRVDLVRNVFPDLDMSGYGGESSGVSRMHARLVLQGNQLYVEDLNSTNYTFVNKLRLQPGQPYLVSDGDEIRLGLLAMIFHTA